MALPFNICEERSNSSEVVASAVSKGIAERIANMLRKAHPHNAYYVVQAPKERKQNQRPGDWSHKTRRRP